MRKITVTNFKGNEYSGSWNEKTYTSTIKGQPDLFRIYIDDEAIHITKDELEKLVAEKKSLDDSRIYALMCSFNQEEKESILENLLTDFDFMGNSNVDIHEFTLLRKRLSGEYNDYKLKLVKKGDK